MTSLRGPTCQTPVLQTQPSCLFPMACDADESKIRGHAAWSQHLLTVSSIPSWPGKGTLGFAPSSNARMTGLARLSEIKRLSLLTTPSSEDTG